MASIKVYGTDDCPDTRSTRAHLDRLGIEYQYFNLRSNRQAAQWVRDHNDGKEKKPTLDIDGEVIAEPSSRELDQALRAKGLLA